MLFLWLAFFFAAATGGAAPMGPFYVDAWKTGPGLLPQSSVIAMTQTHDGYLWLGTVNGLVRFDGSHFAVFDESATPRLGSSAIVRLFEDREHNLWIGTDNAGVLLVKNGKVNSLNIGRRLAAICQDSMGAIWMLTESELGRYWQGEVNVWNLNAPGRCMAAEANGRVWVGTDRGISGIDPAAVKGHELGSMVTRPAQGNYFLASKDGGIWELSVDLQDGRTHIQKWRSDHVEKDLGSYPWSAPTEFIKAACEDLSGNLIVGLRDQGIFWFDSNGQFTHLGDTNGLSINSVLSLQMDPDGNLWAGLDGTSRDGGPLNCVRRPALHSIPESAGQVIESAAVDAAGALWFSSHSLNLSVARVSAGGLSNYFSSFGRDSVGNTSALLIDSHQAVWAGTFGRGLLRLEGNLFRPAPGSDQINLNPWIYALHEDRRGTLWVGTQNGLASWDGKIWRNYTTADGLTANVIRAIADDRQGNIWIGAERGGLNRLKDGHFTAFQRTNGFPTDNVSSLWVDDEDVLWVGAAGNGLIRMQDGKWTHYTRRDGLITDIVDYIIDDKQGFLWMGTDWGLMRIPKKAFENNAAETINSIPCRLFDQRDGLPNIDCTVRSQPAPFRAPNGTLFLPTIGGIVSVDPSTLRVRTNAPPVVIQSVSINTINQNTNDLPTVPLAAVTVPVGKEQLEIEYASLQIGAADRAQFRYILENHDSQWTEAHASRIVRYSGLPPGHYRFRVIASSEDGFWDATQPGAALEIEVLPPFWQTLWFRIVAVACLIGLVGGIVFYVSTQRLQRQVANLRQQQALENERARIARDIHDQVGASLTQISLLGEMVESDKDEPAEVEAHGRQLTQTARETAHALDEIVWTVNPRNDTLEGLVNYICKHAQDYLGVAGVRYRLDIPTSLPPALIAPEARHNVFLAAKEAITNVVRHARATEASVRLTLEPARFILEIEDNGRGLADLDPKTTRNGLRNMRKRMEDIGGAFDLVPGPSGHGALVRLTVPLHY
jgi:ligand-binding sensor domain-containing protein/signal transduction histidine kinase